MGYKELDLYSLYKEVLCYGGFQKVSPVMRPNIEGISFLRRNKFATPYLLEYFHYPQRI